MSHARKIRTIAPADDYPEIALPRRAGSMPMAFVGANSDVVPPRWAQAKCWLDGAARRIAMAYASKPLPSCIEAELAFAIDSARSAGLAVTMSRTQREKLAAQIKTWFERRERAAAQRLTHGALAMLIASA